MRSRFRSRGAVAQVIPPPSTSGSRRTPRPGPAGRGTLATDHARREDAHAVRIGELGQGGVAIGLRAVHERALGSRSAGAEAPRASRSARLCGCAVGSDGRGVECPSVAAVTSTRSRRCERERHDDRRGHEASAPARQAPGRPAARAISPDRRATARGVAAPRSRAAGGTDACSRAAGRGRRGQDRSWCSSRWVRRMRRARSGASRTVLSGYPGPAISS